MLTQLLAQLGSLQFTALPAIKAAGLPLALIAALHVMLLWLFDRARYDALVASPAKLETSAAGLVMFVLAAVVLSNVNALLIEILEGKHFGMWRRTGGQWVAKRRLERGVSEAQTQLGMLSKMRSALPGDPEQEWPTSDEPLRWETAADTYGVRQPLEEGSEEVSLPIAERELRSARDWWKYEEFAWKNRLSFQYPLIPIREKDRDFSAATLAPSLFGNIGRTMRAYALSRYSMDLEIFWTRLQRTIGNAADKFPATLASAKADVDFAVVMTFLSGLLAVGWTGYLIGRPTIDYFDVTVVAGLTPILVYGFYRLACRSYLVFADLMRTAVDSYRLSLLADLSMPMPTNTKAEEEMWLMLGKRIGYGAKASFSYKVKS